MPLLGRLLRPVLSRATLALTGLLALCGFIWFAGPLFAFADVKPLASERARALAIAALGLLALLWALARLWRRKNLNARLLDQIAKARESARARQTLAPDAGQLEELQARFSQAIRAIRGLRVSKGGLKRLSGRYIYELPWYIVIGAPGSGKTTALLNSGLHFPLEEKLGRAALKGVGGTRNCDWWVTDEAIILDTAGRYATHDSQADADSAEWRGFLDLLRKYRPRQPINGIILTLSAADLLIFDAQERDAHCSALRARLSELQASFGIELPVYLWVTKIDLLSGFNEFFDGYSAEQRQQVWGLTFPSQERAASAVASFDREWALLQQRLYALQDPQLAHETEPARLAAIYSFPQQLAGLQAILRAAISAVFRDSRQVARPLLRGVYLSSGTQQGTPFDRILTTLRLGFASRRRAEPPSAAGGGKSYFLHDLFTRLIFKEAHLAGRNTGRERRLKGLALAGYGACALALAFMTGAWLTSYLNNRQYLGQVASEAAQLAQAVAAHPQDGSDLLRMIELLNATASIGGTPAFPREQPPLSYRYGLYQGGKVGTAASVAYEQMLASGLLPLVARRLQAQLRQPPVDGLEYLFEALKSYLMLHEAEHFDPAHLRRWVAADARRHLLPDAPTATLDQLDAHLAALLRKDRALASPFPIQQPLVDDARARLAALSATQRIYHRLRGRLEAVPLPEFNLLDAAGPQAANLLRRRSKLPLNRGVSGLFTYRGYWEVFDKEAGQAAAQLADDDSWVMGLPAKGAGARLDEAMQGQRAREVRMAYLRDYAEIWEQYLGDIELVPSDSLQSSIQRVRALSAPDSPLPLLLRAVVRETTLLRKGRDGEPGMVDRARQKLKEARDDIERVVGPAHAGAAPAERRPESIVDERFEPLRRLAGTPDAPGPAPIDAVLKTLDDYYGTLVATDAALRSGNAPPSQEPAVRLRAEAARMPQPVRDMLDRIAASSSAQAGHLARAAVGSSLDATVGDFCRRAIAGRYPLRRNASAEAVPEDFGRLFAPGGLMDEFFGKNLAPIVDTARWAFKRNIDGSWAGGSSALAAFQRASVIRDVFFRGGERTPSIRLGLKVVEMDPAITSMALDVDGTVVRYSHGPQLGQSVAWPGPRGRNQVLLQISGQGFGDAGLKTEGPWALHRFFDRLTVTPGASPEKFIATASVGGKKIVFEASANGVRNPFRLRQLEEFSCPGQF